MTKSSHFIVMKLALIVDISLVLHIFFILSFSGGLATSCGKNVDYNQMENLWTLVSQVKLLNVFTTPPLYIFQQRCYV